MRLPLLWSVSLLATGCTVAPALAAPLCEYFSPADADAYVEAAVRALGDAESSIEDKDYAVRLLGTLGTASVALGYKSSACSAVVAALASGDLEQIHHGISLSAGVGRCSNAKTHPSSDRVAEALETKHDLWSMYHATIAAQHLGLDISQKGILDKVLDLVDTDGSVRSFPGGAVEDGNAFMAAELLAKLVPSTEGDAKAIALRTVEEMKDEVLRLEPALLVQLNRANGEDLAVKATKLKTMARELLEASHTTRPKGMLTVYEALKAIEGYPKAPLPIKLSPSSPSVDQFGAGSVSLLVTSLLGSQEKVKSASFSALLDADGFDVLAGEGSGAPPLGAPDSEGLRALPAVKVAAGMYTAEFAVEVEGGEEGRSLTAKLPVAVGSDAVLAKARVSVSGNSDIEDAIEAEEATVQSYVLAPGETLPEDAHASTLEGHYVHFVLSLKGGASAAPHQVFVRFTHALTGLDTFFVAAPGADGGGGSSSSSRGVREYLVSISLGEESATFLQRSGAYKVAVLVGGPLVTPPSLEELGVIDLDFPVSKERHWPIYSRALLHETDVALGPLPEKHHTFREPEVRPSAGVSLLFTGLVLAALAGLGHGLRVVGANLGRVPDGVVGKAWCVAFQAGLAGIVALFVTYWVALTMTYMMQVLALLSLVTTFTGRKALQTLASEAEGSGRKGRSGDHVKVD